MVAFAIVFAFLGGFFLLFGGIFAAAGLFRDRHSKTWLNIQGTIVKKGKLFLNVPDRYPSFKYEVNGKVYEKTSSIYQTPGFKDGSIITILYNPDNPHQAIIDSFVQRGTVFKVLGYVFIGVGIFFLTISVIIFFVF